LDALFTPAGRFRAGTAFPLAATGRPEDTLDFDLLIVDFDREDFLAEAARSISDAVGMISTSPGLASPTLFADSIADTDIR
jgi:hypothetical protein